MKRRTWLRTIKMHTGVKKEFGVQSSIDARRLSRLNKCCRSKSIAANVHDTIMDLSIMRCSSYCSCCCCFVYRRIRLFFSIMTRERERVPSIKWFRTLSWAMDEEGDERKKKTQPNRTELNGFENHKKWINALEIYLLLLCDVVVNRFRCAAHTIVWLKCLCHVPLFVFFHV